LGWGKSGVPLLYNQYLTRKKREKRRASWIKGPHSFTSFYRGSGKKDGCCEEGDRIENKGDNGQITGKTALQRVEAERKS